MGFKSSIISLIKGLLELIAKLAQLLHYKIEDVIKSLDRRLKIHMLIEQIINNNRGSLTIHRSIIDLHELAQRIIQMGGKLVDEFAYSLRKSDALHNLKVTVCEFKGKIVELGLKNNDSLNVIWYKKDDESYPMFLTIKSMHHP
ncbi:MAG: hypothetical protein ACXQTI_06830 [Candidatus Nezhaarchaeales archaeon]